MTMGGSKPPGPPSENTDGEALRRAAVPTGPKATSALATPAAEAAIVADLAEARQGMGDAARATLDASTDKEAAVERLDATEVWIVDDEVYLPRAIGRLVKNEVKEIKTFNTTAEIIEALREAPLANIIIISDIQMPGMRGTELREQIILEHGAKAPPFIIMTAMDDQSAVTDLQAAGIAVLAKPFETAKILAILRAEIMKKKTTPST